MRRNRFRRIYWQVDKRFWVTLYLAVLLAVGWWSYGDWGQQVMGKAGEITAKLVWEDLFAFAEWNESSLADIFAASLPLWSKEELAKGEFTGENSGTESRSYSEGNDPEFSFWESVTGIRLGTPHSYLEKGLPLFSGYYQKVALKSDGGEEEQEQSGDSDVSVPGPQTLDPSGSQSNTSDLASQNQGAETSPPQLTDPGKQPAVFIYNTHTGENYAYPRGLVKVAGKKGGVVDVAGIVRKRLESKYQVKVIQSETIHDSDWLHSNPYAESFQTAKRQINANPSLQIVLDVHRDAQVPRENTVVKINGKSVARIMLVVGTNARNNHPNWLKNYRFAQQLGKELDKSYPGLLRKIMTKRGRYNQHLHPRALVVEIGSTENSTAEAVAAGELLADVLAKMLTKGD